MNGAVDISEGPEARARTQWGNRSVCRCEKCYVCGWGKHMVVHGPAYGEPPGSKPYDHEFVPLTTSRRE